VFLVLAVLGAVFVFANHKSAPAQDDSMIQTADLPKLAPEDIGMVGNCQER